MLNKLDSFYSKGSPNECWIWRGSLVNHGYGTYRAENAFRAEPAHRAVYKALVGPIPDGMELDHLCGNRGCVNPAHLEPVSVSENRFRIAHRVGRRTHSAYSEILKRKRREANARNKSQNA